MAGWHVIEKYLEETGAQSTLVGKYSITMFLTLRLLMLVITEVAFGEDYKDRAHLECDTKTPGCRKMCINQFYPLQPNFYFSLQLLSTALPILIFMVYCSHKLEKLSIARKLKKERLAELKCKTLANFKLQKAKISKDRTILAQKKNASAKMFEHPNGQRFSPDEVTAILDREEEVRDCSLGVVKNKF